MARLLGCAFVVGVAVWLAGGPRVSAAAVDCWKPVAPCTACHSRMLTRNYSDCAAKPWTPPPEAKELHSLNAARHYNVERHAGLMPWEIDGMATIKAACLSGSPARSNAAYGYVARG